MFGLGLKHWKAYNNNPTKKNCGPRTSGAEAYTWHRVGHMETEGLARELCLMITLAPWPGCADAAEWLFGLASAEGTTDKCFSAVIGPG